MRDDQMRVTIGRKDFSVSINIELFFLSLCSSDRDSINTWMCHLLPNITT